MSFHNIAKEVKESADMVLIECCFVPLFLDPNPVATNTRPWDIELESAEICQNNAE